MWESCRGVNTAASEVEYLASDSITGDGVRIQAAPEREDMELVEFADLLQEVLAVRP